MYLAAFQVCTRLSPPLRLQVGLIRLPPAIPPLLRSIIDIKAQTDGLSFFSTRSGLVCSNILRYELVLESGSITTASASTNPDFWRVLKGGSNHFGIVTRFTARSFPSTKMWSGFLKNKPATLTATHAA
jgi:hypothetical protein